MLNTFVLQFFMRGNLGKIHKKYIEQRKNLIINPKIFYVFKMLP